MTEEDKYITRDIKEELRPCYLVRYKAQKAFEESPENKAKEAAWEAAKNTPEWKAYDIAYNIVIKSDVWKREREASANWYDACSIEEEKERIRG